MAQFLVLYEMQGEQFKRGERKMTSTYTTKHTPTPWLVDDEIPASARSVIVRCGNVPISGNTNGPHEESDRANAAHIVKCANVYDELVAALEAVERTLDSNFSSAPFTPQYGRLFQAWLNAQCGQKIRDALAKVRS